MNFYRASNVGIQQQKIKISAKGYPVFIHLTRRQKINIVFCQKKLYLDLELCFQKLMVSNDRPSLFRTSSVSNIFQLHLQMNLRRKLAHTDFIRFWVIALFNNLGEVLPKSWKKLPETSHVSHQRRKTFSHFQMKPYTDEKQINHLLKTEANS